MIQSGIRDPLNLIKRFISFRFWDWTNCSCTSLSKIPYGYRRELGYPGTMISRIKRGSRSSRIPRVTRISETRMSRIQRGTNSYRNSWI